jgi:hypothetical protein
MLANGDGISLNAALARHYFRLAASNGYLNRKDFMISPSCEALFKNTKTLFEIPQKMFNFCTDQVKSISLPASVDSLHAECFSGATFKRVIIPVDSQLLNIHESVFSDCTFLESIFIPSSVQVLGERCFENCVSLESVTFGASSQLKMIPSWCCVGCSSLKSICIPAACEKIHRGAFSAVCLKKTYEIWCCKSLKSVLFESGSRLNV